MIIKVEFSDEIGDNRKYSIGIKKFLSAAGLKLTDEQIKTTIQKLLSKE